VLNLSYIMPIVGTFHYLHADNDNDLAMPVKLIFLLALS
jgi:hypothetical protein